MSCACNFVPRWAPGLLVVLSLCGGCRTAAIRPPPKDAVLPVVAVTTFDNRSGFDGQWQLGGGMADLLVSEMLKSGHFIVVERQQFEHLASEIGLQGGRLFRPEGRVNIGRMKGAKFLIRGTINDFSQAGGGGLWMAMQSFFFLGRGHNARVSLTLTIIDIETGQIVSSVQSIGLVRTRYAYFEKHYQGVSFGGDAFFRTPLGKATADAIREGVGQIVGEMPHDSWRPMIADVRGRILVVNGGKDRGFKVGEELVVRAPAEPVTDPATGDVLSYLPGAQIGRLRIIQLDDRVAFGEAVSGSGFQRGQWLVRAQASSPPL
jgi:curli biogenesis system outer membrane secretion channel CsgG